MAGPTYTTDLTTLSEADDFGNWDESSNAAWDDAGSMVDEENFYIQEESGAATCVSAQFTKDGVGTIIYGHGSSVAIPTPGAVLIWHFWASPPSLAVLASGGVRAIVGNSFGDFEAWKVSGSNFEPSPIGGWYNYAVDPSLTYDYTIGTVGSPFSHFGIAVSATAQARGNPNAIDVIRYGRCEARYVGGEAADYATFAGFAGEDNDPLNMWALLQNIPGGYKWQGLMTLGYGGAVDFRDSNKSILVANTLNVVSDFNKIELDNVSSNVEWTNISITALGTVSRGNFEMLVDLPTSKIGCVFTDMGTFAYDSLADIVNTTYRRTDLISALGGSFTGCIFEEVRNGISVLCSTTSNIEGCTFLSDDSNHAIKIDTPGIYDLDDNIFTNYAVTNGSGGNEVIFNDSGGEVTLNASGNTGVLSVRNGTSATTILNEDLITFKLTGLPSNTEVTIVNASTRAELYHIENSSGDVTHTYTTGGAVVDVLIHHVDYDPHIGQLLDYTLPSISTTLPVTLVLDNTYI